MKKAALLAGLLFCLTASLIAGPGLSRFQKEIPYSNEREVKLSLDFAMGEISLARGEGDFIARIEGTYDSELFEVRVDTQNHAGVLNLEIGVKQLKSFKLRNDDSKNEWHILLGDRVPLHIAMEFGMAQADLDLSGLPIAALNIDFGTASGTVVFQEPNPAEMKEFSLEAGMSSLVMTGLGNANFRQLNADCGMASVELDFSGQGNLEASVFMDIGMGSAKISIPPRMGVRIWKSGNLTAPMTLNGEFYLTSEDCYESMNYKEADGHLNFEIEVAMGSLEFNSMKSL